MEKEIQLALFLSKNNNFCNHEICYSVKILKTKLNDPSIDDSKIINMIFNLLFHNNINEIGFDEQIQNILLDDLLCPVFL